MATIPSVPPPVDCGEITAGEIDPAIALRNTCFAPLPRAGWDAEPPLTACVARQGDALVGVLPLALRTVSIGAGRSVTAAFEHSVCTRADQRGRGIGTLMIASAREWLRGRVDALFVYRTREESAGYRFYEKTGHVDLLYARRHLLAHPGGAAPAAGISVAAGPDAICAREQASLALWRRELGGLAGNRPRERGFHTRALGGFYFSAHPQEFLLVQSVRDGELAAYALLGVPQLAQDPAVVNVLEFVAADARAGRDVLATAAQLAAERARPVHCVTSDTHPLIPVLHAAGFVPEGRHQVLMAQLLDPAALAAKVWRQGAALDATRVLAWTPAGEFVLHAPATAARTLRLEMKLATLTRLLLGRLRPSSALELELITGTGLEAGDPAALDEALPFTPWCYHAIDYL